MSVSSDDQVKFLLNIQRLLMEGLFTATYKFALLNALADLAVEVGDDTSAPLDLSASDIAVKFIEYYWRQATPFFSSMGNSGELLKQNSDKQATVIREIADFRSLVGDSLSDAKRMPTWKSLVQRVSKIVTEMPLWKLQRVGNEVLDFLYENVGAGTSITLRPGVVCCLRIFHGLVTELVRGAWMNRIRQFNAEILGQAADLQEFLFGSERISLAPLREILGDAQEGRCLYCAQRVSVEPAIDHFVPWSLYPIDLAHNFVLSHAKCNSAKSNRIAAEEHLLAWTGRNRNHMSTLASGFDQIGIAHSWSSSLRITRWAYTRVASGSGKVWLRSNELLPLEGLWAHILDQVV